VAGYNPAEGISIAESLYQAYPDLTITAECGMNGAIGMYMMMKEKGMDPNSIINVAWTTLPEVIEGMKAGYIHGTVRQNPYVMGYLSTYALKWYIDGKRPSTNYFDSGVAFATAENVDTIDDELKDKVPAMFAEFKKLWQ
jgi:ABC-type sugar transport system substrate-binding protein